MKRKHLSHGYSKKLFRHTAGNNHVHHKNTWSSGPCQRGGMRF